MNADLHRTENAARLAFGDFAAGSPPGGAAARGIPFPAAAGALAVLAALVAAWLLF